MGSRPKHRF